MGLLRAVFRLCCILLLILAGLLITIVVAFTQKAGEPTELRRRWCALLCKALGLKMTVVIERSENAGAESTEHDTDLSRGSALIAANHTSWVDPLVIGGIEHGYALSKIEVKRWPIIGWMVGVNGTLFIARGEGASPVVDVIADELQKNHSVTFFPEATTTSGEQVCNFYPKLFDSAIQAARPVQPIMITYPAVNQSGEQVVSDDLAYIENTSLLGIAFKMLSKPATPVEVRVLPRIASVGKSRDQLAKETELAVRASHADFYDHRYDHMPTENPWIREKLKAERLKREQAATNKSGS